MKKTALWIMAILLLTAPASAHYLWVSAQDGQYVVNRGVLSKPPEAYDPVCVKSITAYAEDGTSLPVEKIDESTRRMFRATMPVAMAVVVSDWGYRVNTTSGKKMMTRQQAEAEDLRVISAFFSRQFSKTIFHFSAYQLKPKGLAFEIVPLADPTIAGPGTSIPFKLFFQGEPLGKVTIHTNDGQKIDTDEKGEFLLPVTQSGFHSFYARHKVPVQNHPEMDYMQLMTFMTFTAKE